MRVTCIVIAIFITSIVLRASAETVESQHVVSHSNIRIDISSNFFMINTPMRKLDSFQTNLDIEHIGKSTNQTNVGQDMIAVVVAAGFVLVGLTILLICRYRTAKTNSNDSHQQKRE